MLGGNSSASLTCDREALLQLHLQRRILRLKRSYSLLDLGSVRGRERVGELLQLRCRNRPGTLRSTNWRATVAAGGHGARDAPVSAPGRGCGRASPRAKTPPERVHSSALPRVTGSPARQRGRAGPRVRQRRVRRYCARSMHPARSIRGSHHDAGGRRCRQVGEPVVTASQAHRRSCRTGWTGETPASEAFA